MDNTKEGASRNRSIEELEREIQTLKDEVRKKDEAIKKKDEAIKEKDEMATIHNKRSLKRMIDEPPKMEMIVTGSLTSHTKSSYYLPAEAQEGQFLLQNLNEVMFSPQLLQSPSSLIVEFGLNTKTTTMKDSPLTTTVVTEADVSNIVSRVLKDAVELSTAATGIKLVVRHQPSLFAKRPDHLVVFHASGDNPLLIVEDKKPYGSYLTQEKTVTGQIFDYLVAMRAFGRSAPYAILTTFRKSVVLWHDDEDSNNIAEDKDGIRSKIIATTSNKDSGCGTIQLSTSSSGVYSSAPAEVLEGRAQKGRYTNVFKGHERRILWQSSEYDTREILSLFFTAILCALVRNPHAKEKPLIVRPTTGYIGNALKLVSSKKTNYTWGELSAKRKSLIKESTGRWKRILLTQAAGDVFYVIQDIGVGSTSRTFLALDGHANECVIKMFVNRHDEENNYLEKSAFEKRAKTSTEREAKALIATYSVLKGKVNTKRINGHYCVVMPFFAPIRQDRRLSPEVQGKVKKAFQQLHKLGKTYNDWDVCWSHLGEYKDNVILFDLADLVKVEVDKDVATSIKIDLLNGRAGPGPT